jgi:hypothetical protein
MFLVDIDTLIIALTSITFVPMLKTTVTNKQINNNNFFSSFLIANFMKE